MYQHLAKPQIITDSGNHAAAPRESLGFHRGIEQRRSLPCRWILVRLRYSTLVRFLDVEASRPHPQWPGDTLLNKLIEVLTRNDFYDTPLYIDRHAVFPDLAGLMGERQLG